MQPSPAMGWDNKEQASFLNRCKSDICLALAVIHHLCIGKNLPFEKVASVLNNICTELIIEYVPKSDPKVRAMLSTRKDIFDYYNQEAFENAMLQYFNLIKSTTVEGSDRILYHFQKSKQTT
jgi:ribosomal protein L11 methylase PrmA